jgi:PhzF family phenazine biosynthesis protein
MPALALYQIDAFTSERFRGNPAAVVPLESWLPDETLQAIAAENNLAETAFYAPVINAEALPPPHTPHLTPDFHLRWFTPKIEVALCGHATLATAFVLFRLLGRRQSEVTFHSRSGPLPVRDDGRLLRLDFPVLEPERIAAPAFVAEALGTAPQEVWLNGDVMALLGSEAEVRAVQPIMERLMHLPRGLIVTAPGDEVDFVSRFFAPAAGIPEDPVTGSAHCLLTPFWEKRLGRAELHARQVSERGGELWCRREGDRVHISGEAVVYLEGAIQV